MLTNLRVLRVFVVKCLNLMPMDCKPRHSRFKVIAFASNLIPLEYSYSTAPYDRTRQSISTNSAGRRFCF